MRMSFIFLLDPQSDKQIYTGLVAEKQAEQILNQSDGWKSVTQPLMRMKKPLRPHELDMPKLQALKIIKSSMEMQTSLRQYKYTVRIFHFAL